MKSIAPNFKAFHRKDKKWLFDMTDTVIEMCAGCYGSTVISNHALRMGEMGSK